MEGCIYMREMEKMKALQIDGEMKNKDTETE